MYKRLALFVAGLILAAGTAAVAQTTVDAVGRVVHVDPGAQVIVLDNNQAFRVTPSTVLFVGDRPVALGAVQPGQTVVVRSGEPVAVVPSASVAGQAPSATTVITSPSASPPGLAQQTIYGRIVDVDDAEVKVKTADDDFHVKVPREVAAQLREGDTVRLELTFKPIR